MRILRIVLSVLLILSVVSFGGEVEANDTRNRVFNYNCSTTYDLNGTRMLSPWSSSSVTESEITEECSVNITFKTTAGAIELVDSEITFNDLYPFYQTSIYNISISNSSGGLEPFPYDYTIDSITEDQMNFAKKIKLSGKVQNHTDGSSLKPNSVYTICMFPSIIPSVSRTVSYTNFYPYYKNNLGIIGVNLFYENYYNAPPGWTWSYYTGICRTIIIPADDPSVIVTNITTKNASISWETNNKNPSGTSYTLQCQILKDEGDPANESDWGNWEDVMVGGVYNTTELGVRLDIFDPDHTYRLRVRVNHSAGASYNCYSDYVIFSTSADPAIRAAQEAAIAAQAAKKAAEDTVQYSLDAKTEATGAKNKAQEVYDLVSSLELGNVKEDVSFIKNTMSTPVIQSVKGQNNATATHNDNFVLKIRAAGIQDNLRYRVVCDDFDSGWDTSNTILITGLNTTGIKTAQVYVSNYPDDSGKGSVASAEFTFFKL